MPDAKRWSFSNSCFHTNIDAPSRAYTLSYVTSKISFSKFFGQQVCVNWGSGGSLQCANLLGVNACLEITNFLACHAIVLHWSKNDAYPLGVIASHICRLVSPGDIPAPILVILGNTMHHRTHTRLADWCVATRRYRSLSKHLSHLISAIAFDETDVWHQTAACI